MPISGVFTKDPLVQRGHVGQPSPEDVSRTAPPVTTRTTWPIRDNIASLRMVLLTSMGSLSASCCMDFGRREAVLTVFSILGTQFMLTVRFHCGTLSSI
jgi:hypothetical protein